MHCDHVITGALNVIQRGHYNNQLYLSKNSIASQTKRTNKKRKKH